MRPLRDCKILLLLAGMYATGTMADVIVSNAEFVVVAPNPPYIWSGFLTAPTGRPTYMAAGVDSLGSGDYEFNTGLLAGQRALYSAIAGSDFTSTEAKVWNNELAPPSIINFGIGETKLFAFWADLDGSASGADSGDDYGWVALTYTGTELTIADSATAIGGGIIVGTYTQIPEPSSVLLLSMGAGGILFYRRAKRRQQEQRTNRRSFQ